MANAINKTLMVFGLLLAVIATCFGCAAVTRTFRGEFPGEFRQAVDVKVTCDARVYHGSGVVVGNHTVLTAAHVIRCDKEPEVSVRVFPGLQDEDETPGQYVKAKTAVIIFRRDMALLHVDAWLPASPFIVSPPLEGETVCVSSAYPQREYSCGVVYCVGESCYDEATPSTFAYSAAIQPGNSGAAVYDAKGHLLGIHKGTVGCKGIGECGGFGNMLAGSEWLIK